MPTRREREYYQLGFQDGVQWMQAHDLTVKPEAIPFIGSYEGRKGRTLTKPKRKLSAWNKYVKANSKKPRFRYKSGAKKGKLNLKKMAIAFRKTPAGKRSRKR